MTVFDALLEDAHNREKQFVVYGSDDGAGADELLTTRGVSVTYRDLPPDGPEPFLVVRESGEFVGALALDELEALLAPPVVRPGDRDGASEGYRVLFEALRDTVFTALERSELLAVSREIEERALRVGRGTLRVSFQSLSKFASQTGVYRRLAAATDLDIHVYGADDWTPPEIAGVTYHGDVDPGLEQYWVLAFDGGGSDMQACALLARERRDGYQGCWTNDPETVTEILETLAAA